jgi:hypothetical protein
MLWLWLTPREVEALTTARAHAGSRNAGLLLRLQGNVDRITGELELDEADVDEARVSIRRWQDGGEKGFRAVLSAADRHGHARQNEGC